MAMSLAKKNDMAFYREMSSLSGKADSRYLGRGRVNWSELEEQLQSENSNERKILEGVKKLIHLKKTTRALTLGTLSFIHTSHASGNNLLVIQRQWEKESLFALINLADTPVSCTLADLPSLPAIDLLGNEIKLQRSEILLNGYEYYFIAR
jgi:glycosidase